MWLVTRFLGSRGGRFLSTMSSTIILYSRTGQRRLTVFTFTIFLSSEKSLPVLQKMGDEVVLEGSDGDRRHCSGGCVAVLAGN
jgi:hypothetical protein